MAVAARYSNEYAPGQPVAVYVRFGGNTVAVPLTLESTDTAAGSGRLVGTGTTSCTLSSDTTQIPGGTIVDARIDIAGGELEDAAGRCDGPGDISDPATLNVKHVMCLRG